MNFGVLEVADSEKSFATPGWAYVPDTGVNASLADLQPSSRKRARTQVASSGDTTAKQDAKILRDLQALDRENHRDVIIPVPIRHRDNAGRISHGKVTPAVRKILQSQKTFQNHLSDFQALSALAAAHPTAQPATATPPASVRGSSGTSTPLLSTKRAYRKKDASAVSTPTTLRKVASASASKVSTSVKSEPENDVLMPGAASLSMGSSTLPPTHPADNDPLLVSRIPEVPSQAEIDALLAAPPLTYLEARGPWVDEDMKKPVRRFCEVCGYWGRVRCKNCGGRVCALECLNTHQEECFARYGA